MRSAFYCIFCNESIYSQNYEAFIEQKQQEEEGARNQRSSRYTLYKRLTIDFITIKR